MTDSLLQRVRALTRWSDDELASIVGLSRDTVQSYRTGRRVEYLNRQAKERLAAQLRERQGAWADLAAELELLA